MPKEIINSRHTDDATHEPYAKVGWGKEAGYVELAVLYAGETTLADDTPLGWYVQLDRTGINRLIRTLRTARDQAYGRDE